MPWIAGLRFSSSMRRTIDSSPASAGNSCVSECRPTSPHALTLLRTYRRDAGLLPTMTTASPGVTPRAFNASTRFFHSPLTWRATALPSIILAVMGSVRPEADGDEQQHANSHQAVADEV